MGRSLRWLAVLALLLTQALAAAPVRSASPTARAAASGAWLVRLREDLPAAQARAALAAAGLTPLRQIPRLGIWVADAAGAADAGTAAALAALRERGDVLWFEPNGEYAAAVIHPNDYWYWPQQWNMRQIGLPDAWLYTQGDARPIAIVDTGIDLDHPDLLSKIWRNAGEVPGNLIDDDGNGYVDDAWGWNLVSPGAPPQDDHGHGSHVAGIAGAATDNGTGVAGVSWLSPLMAVKVLDAGSSGSWANVAAGIVYAADNGARVINLSLGGAQYSAAVASAVSYAQGRGCLVVAAAGNNPTQPTPVLYPGALPGVLTVTSVDAQDVVASSSNRGPEVDVAAPGVTIWSTGATGNYYTSSGTSMATPHVSGLAALLWAMRPGETAAQVAATITSTAKDVDSPGFDIRTGWGRIDAAAAVLSFLQASVTVAAGGPSIRVGRETVPITATITDSGGLPVRDGLTVAFESDLGAFAPPTALTANGIATTTFGCNAYFGAATITARLGAYASAPITVTVVPWRSYFPYLRGGGADAP